MTTKRLRRIIMTVSAVVLMMIACRNYKAKVNDCQPLRRSSIPLIKTALASPPGSGNTWTRHILQQATGILTGSVYNHTQLKNNGFPAEGVTDNSVVVIKTHRAPNRGSYDRVVLLVRHPQDTLLADFNRLHSPGHTGLAPEEAFKNQSLWPPYVKRSSKSWYTFNTRWLDARVPVFVLHYDDLRYDFRRTVAAVSQFLGYHPTPDLLDCLVRNSEGNFHRQRKVQQLQHYSPDMLNLLNKTWDRFAAVLVTMATDPGRHVTDINTVQGRS